MADISEFEPHFQVNERSTTGLTVRGKMREPTRRKPMARGVMSVPPSCGWVVALAKRLWKQLYDAVVSRYGEVSISHACLMHTIIRAETACLLLERKRRDFWDVMTIEQSVAISRQIVGGSAQRDKGIMHLGIDPNQLDLFGRAFDAAPDESLGDG